MNNAIYIRRKNKIFVQAGNGRLSDEGVINLLANIEGLGYTLSPDLLAVVSTLMPKRLKTVYKQLIADLRENTGAHVTYEPMYPNFPDQVKKATRQELYCNAFLHYLGDAIRQRIMPEYEKRKRDQLRDSVILQEINLGNKADFNGLFTALLGGKTALSPTDKKDVEWFVKTYSQQVKTLLPTDIPSKENRAHLLGLLITNNVDAVDLLAETVQTATDVLRLATAMSDGDVSLATNTKFKRFSKKNRRLLLQTLETCGAITEDMLRNKGRWKRLGERLHPFEYKHRFPNGFAAFDVIRNDKPFPTFAGNVEKAIANGQSMAAVMLLKTRPGELARRLDKLIRMAGDPAPVLAAFREVAAQVSTPVLLQVRTHFLTRNQPGELRTFFPKGEVSKVNAIDNHLPDIPETVCARVAAICEEALIKIFSNYEPLGRVYLDEALKNYVVPFAMRSAAKALTTVARGSRMPLPSGNTIRFFLYWQDGSSRTDLDLSALALDSDSEYKTTIAYYNQAEDGGYHSGDITSAPNGASEFIDIEVANFLARGIRYVMMLVNSYTNQPYCDLPVCFAGFMGRQYPDSGEIYDPKTVANKFDLTANTRIAIPLILDLAERTVIWTDLSLRDNPSVNNNVHNNLSAVTLINKAMTTLRKPILYDLLALHIRARGERTLDIDDATTIFAVDRGIKPTDIDVLMSAYL